MSEIALDVERRTASRRRLARDVALASIVGIVAFALAVGPSGLDAGGPLWSDSPRYANAAAMMRDWAVSGDWLHPYEFAKRNYVQYPAFNVPYHPPGYPAMLGSVFLLTGVSHVAARAFIAVCVAVAGAVFFGLMRRLGAGSAASACGALILVTTPDMVRWSRDTMSEVPSLALSLLAALALVEWSRSDRPRWAIAAVLLGGAAFLSRVTSVALLPASVLWLALVDRRKLARRNVWIVCGLLMVAVLLWVRMVKIFARLETGADGRDDLLAGAGLLSLGRYLADVGPRVAGWGTTIAGLSGLIAVTWAARARGLSRAAAFGVAWSASVILLKIAVPTSHEVRHIFGIWPGLAALAIAGTESAIALAGASKAPRVATLGALAAMAVVALGANFVAISEIPGGVTGYDAVAERLALLERPGNVLIACPFDAQIMFLFRARVPDSQRRMIRADRTLAIRLSDYARQSAKVVARSAADVMETMRRGRARYLVTCDTTGSPSTRLSEGAYDDEARLAHQVAVDNPEHFRPIASCPVVHAFQENSAQPCFHGVIVTWEYLDALPEGPSELSVLVPTAGMDLK